MVRDVVLPSIHTPSIWSVWRASVNASAVYSGATTAVKLLSRRPGVSPLRFVRLSRRTRPRRQRKVPEAHRFQMLHVDDVPDRTALNKRADERCVWRVSEHVADAKPHIGFLRSGHDAATFDQCRSHGLFEQDVVSGGSEGRGRVEVFGVVKADDDRAT
jgi:hypothetical protein